MKEENRDCKIVQDLLPNYLENLTSEVTNEFIEQHIAKCPECKKVFNNMSGEIEVEEINQDKEINYLKGIRKRVKRTITMVSLIVIIIASCIVCYIYNQSRIQVNNYTFLRASYVREDQENSNDGNIYGSLIAVFDEKDICKSVRVMEKGYIEEGINHEKDTFITDSFSNIVWNHESITYNINTWNGETKEQVKEYLLNNYNIEILEEI